MGRGITATCGTVSGNQRHRILKEIICESCRVAAAEHQSRYHAANPEKVKIYKMRRASIIANNLKIIQELKLSTGCVDCGYNTHPEALDFDHLGDKKFNIGIGINSGRSLNKVLIEIDKCEVVCSNCHRVRTANRRAEKKLNKQTMSKENT